MKPHLGLSVGGFMGVMPCMPVCTCSCARPGVLRVPPVTAEAVGVLSPPPPATEPWSMSEEEARSDSPATSLVLANIKGEGAALVPDCWCW